MPEDKGPAPESIQVKLTFRVPQRMPSLYAHHMMIQPGEYEVLLSFFEIIPPPSFTTEEDHLKKLKETGVIAECVARITIAKDRFQVFAKAMQDILVAIEAQSGDEVAVQVDANGTRDNPEG